MTGGSARRPKVDVIVVGAGLAGLATASKLQRAGCSVVVLEATGSVGGRVQTRASGIIPTGVLDAVANAIDVGDERTRKLIERFELKTVDEVIEQPSGLFINGALMSPDAWENSPHNLVEYPFRAVHPVSLGIGFMARHDQFTSSDDWFDSKFDRLDVAPIELLRREAATDERIRLTALSLLGGDVYQYSMLSLLQKHHQVLDRSRTMTRSQPSQRLVGGLAALTEALAGSLGDSVNLDAVVSAIDLGDVTLPVLVETIDGRQFRSDHVVAAVPFSALRSVELRQLTDDLLHQAIRSMPYIPLTQVWARVTEPFWERDGLPPSTFSDALFGTCSVRREADGDYWVRFALNGVAARRIDSLPAALALKTVVDVFHRARPSSVGCLEPVALMSWENEPYIRGLRHAYRPGDVRRFAEKLSHPHGPHGRLHLAGEHTRRREFGAEAALESAERVAKEILGKQRLRDFARP